MLRPSAPPPCLAILLLAAACFDKPDAVDSEGGTGNETGSATSESATGEGSATSDDGPGSTGSVDESTGGEEPGVPQWTITRDGPGHWQDWIEGIAIDPASGDIVVVGNLAKAENDRDHWIARFDRDGNEIWSETDDPSNGLSDALYAVVIAADGTIVVAGGVARPDFAPDQPNADIFVGARDPNGTALWSIEADVDGGWDQAGGVALQGNGNVIVAATASTASSGLDAWVGAFVPGSEGPLWTYAHDGGALSTDFAEAVVVGAGDSVYVAGSVAELDDGGIVEPNDILVMALSPDGELAWSRALDGAGFFDFGHAIAIGDQGLHVVGTFGIDMMGSTTDLVVARYDTIGNLAGSSQWGEGGGNHGHAIAVDGLSRSWIAGATAGDILIGRWDGDGDPAWSDLVDGRAGGTDSAGAIAIASDGSIVVGGRIETVGADDDAWLRRYSPVR
jgi:hypothetical protein